VIGLVLIIEGSPYFLFPEKLKKFFAQILNIPDSYLRLLGLLAMLGGLFLLFIGRNWQ